MRKEIKHKIPFIDDSGKQDYIDINISFVPNIAVKMYNEIIGIIHSVQRAWDEMNYIIAEMASLEKEKPEGWKQKKLNKEIEFVKKSETIKNNGDQEFFKKRIDLVFLLLKKNGIIEERFFDIKFWDECVDPADILDFINTAIWKDESKKKVQ